MGCSTWCLSCARAASSLTRSPRWAACPSPRRRRRLCRLSPRSSTATARAYITATSSRRTFCWTSTTASRWPTLASPPRASASPAPSRTCSTRPSARSRTRRPSCTSPPMATRAGTTRRRRTSGRSAWCSTACLPRASPSRSRMRCSTSASPQSRARASASCAPTASRRAQSPSSASSSTRSRARGRARASCCRTRGSTASRSPSRCRRRPRPRRHCLAAASLASASLRSSRR
mmetsp:Transcript_5061/g.15791  ORF Transcript_5061/g.15791 Transcript_5061/m.15791 type:complete len:233 (-) Transcript_5061:30-728(-)